jgi:hypothetical protein
VEVGGCAFLLYSAQVNETLEVTWQANPVADETGQTEKLATADDLIENQDFAQLLVEEQAWDAAVECNAAKADETRFVAVREMPELEQIAIVDVEAAVAADGVPGP